MNEWGPDKNEFIPDSSPPPVKSKVLDSYNVSLRRMSRECTNMKERDGIRINFQVENKRFEGSRRFRYDSFD